VRRRSLVWQIYLPFLLLTLCALLAAMWYAVDSTRQFHLEQTSAALEAQAHLFKRQIEQALHDAPDTDALCKELGGLSGTRITVVLPSGDVVGDSDEDPKRMDNHGNRPEIKQAAAGQVGHSVRYSHTLRTHFMYAAVPMLEDGAYAGVVRTSVALASVEQAFRRIFVRIVLVSISVALLVVALSLAIARRIIRPLQEMRAGAEAFARGDLQKRLRIPDADELADLTMAMNNMAQQLDERIQATKRQRNERDAILASMAEGVVAVDTEERIINLNLAAADLLGIAAEAACGHAIHEMSQEPKLQRCVAQALAGSEIVEDETRPSGPDERILHVRATVLRDEQGRKLGAVIVLNDITQLRRLERARSDFVANVSHEIRTPVTSIKGYTETLLDGALADPEDANRFLRIVLRQADRLAALVDDILTIAAMEQPQAVKKGDFESHSIRDAIELAVQACEPKATDRNVRIETICGDDLRANISLVLIEQAITNLLDNAIKYSDPGGVVRVEAVRADSELLIKVRDFGCGIEAEHLPRLFERFYRADKARSRALGGTGLGLAIVKHIAISHGGRVTVESTPGEGSCFIIVLPHEES